MGNFAGNFAGNFKICKSSAGNAVGNVAEKYSFLKPILNQFSHMLWCLRATRSSAHLLKLYHVVAMAAA